MPSTYLDDTESEGAGGPTIAAAAVGSPLAACADNLRSGGASKLSYTTRFLTCSTQPAHENRAPVRRLTHAVPTRSVWAVGD